MSETNRQPSNASLLQSIARRAMLARGLAPDFSAEALAELTAIRGPAAANDSTIRDLRNLLWCSIDNDDSRDLDQLSVAEALPAERIKLLVAIADVAALVRQASALDQHAAQNTTSVYTPSQIFPMLPEKLSTDLTSLNFGTDRLAIVVELTVAPSGEVEGSSVYQASVRNCAKLAYNSVAAWLDGSAPIPAGIEGISGLAENIRLQLRAAQTLKQLRHAHGALTFETTEAHPIFSNGTIRELALAQRNSAKDLIEDLMIAANGATARFLAAKQFPSIRRVVRTPKHWDHIVELALTHGVRLPEIPDAKALEDFLTTERAKDPLRFPDLSLSVIKLLGAGEYVVELPGGTSAGHFGLAVKDYAHSTAPNRRFPDLLTQRLLKAALTGNPPPYSPPELATLAQHCTEQEDAAKKVERQVIKSAAALLLESQIGKTFDALVTGAASKGTWVRVSYPPVEGKLMRGFENRRVGDRLRVQLVHTDVERGLIDFVAVQ